MALKFIPLLVFALLGAFLFKGLYLEPRKLPSNFLDKPVPDFYLPGLNSGDKGLSQADFKGQYSLLNVWATWCMACRDDHGFLMDLASKGVVIFGLDYKDDRQSANQWLQSLGNPYKAIGFDKPGRVAIDFGIYGTPETFLIDAKGIIRYRHVGVLNQQTWQESFVPVINRLKELS